MIFIHTISLSALPQIPICQLSPTLQAFNAGGVGLGSMPLVMLTTWSNPACTYSVCQKQVLTLEQYMSSIKQNTWATSMCAGAVTLQSNVIQCNLCSNGFASSYLNAIGKVFGNG